MQLRHLRTFVAAAEALNFTRAGERLHLAQSSVTEQIQALEADLGIPLFERTRRRLALTAGGRRLLDYAGELLALSAEARAAALDAADADGGSLTVGGLETICAAWLPPVLAAFRRAQPAVRLTLRTAGSGALRSGLRSGELDLCFGFDGLAEEPGVACAEVGRDDLVVVVPAAHRLAGAAGVSAAALAGEDFLVTEPGCTYRAMFERGFPAGERPRIAGEFGSIAAITRLVGAGAGCALLPRLAVPPDHRGLAALPWRAAAVPIRMAWRRRRVQPPALRLFVEAVRGGCATPADARPRHAALSR